MVVLNKAAIQKAESWDWCSNQQVNKYISNTVLPDKAVSSVEGKGRR